MLQVGTLVKVHEPTLSGGCLPPWLGRVTEIDRYITVSNGTRTASFLKPGEVEEISELLPLR